MIELNIPGKGTIQLEHLVTDVNGTLAVDGQLIEGVSQLIGRLREHLTIHMVTADTHGRQSLIDQQLNLTAFRLQPAPLNPDEPGFGEGFEARQKAEYVQRLGAERVIAIGQGANDALMMRSARIGICVLSPEGTAIETMNAANLVAPNIRSALEIVENPLRLIATLRI